MKNNSRILSCRHFLALGAALLTTYSIAQSEDNSSMDTSQEGFRILLIGNSHSSRNDLPSLIAMLIEAGQANAIAYADAAPGWAFLADRLDHAATLKALDAQQWTHVILQAQKYSSSGRYYYPTDAAEEWIRRIRRKESVPILFPEWARRGNNEEGSRIYKLHLEIASREAACVAPIAHAWQLVLDVDPAISLHASDGNHSNNAGALLTAYVLYQAITGDPADEIPDIVAIKIDPEIQDLLRRSASQAHDSLPGCRGAHK